MANPTSNFGWQMPTNTDLVKDLPADFEVFGQAVDTSLMDLKGGTTGQVLSKASNTDMDFTWVAQDDSNAIQNAIVDAKGDLITATAADTPARLAVGTNGQVLTADSTQSTGLAWTTISSGSLTLISTTNLSGATTTLSSIPQTYTDLRVVVQSPTITAGTATFRITFNGVTSGEYLSQMMFNASTPSNQSQLWSGNATSLLSTTADNLRKNVYLIINEYTNTTYGKPIMLYSNFGDSSTNNYSQVQGGVFASASAITSIEIRTGASTFNGGRVLLYGVK